MPIETPTKNGLVDWYARGQNLANRQVSAADQYVKLSTSPIGGLVLALKIDEDIAPATVTLRMLQRLTADVPFTEYIFNTPSENSVISGRDVSGKNLRFDQRAIDEDRVQVQVNGIVRNVGSGPTDYQLSPNIVTFNTPLVIGDRVSVLLFGTAPTSTSTVLFARNALGSSPSNAWGNIRWVEIFNSQNGEYDKWLLYVADSTGAISTEAQFRVERLEDTTSQTKIVELTDVVFLMAYPPYSNVDRDRNTYVKCATLAEDFYLKSSTTAFTELLVSANLVSDASPAFRLIGSGKPAQDNSYITVDTFPTGTSSDTIIPVKSNILGPS